MYLTKTGQTLGPTKPRWGGNSSLENQAVNELRYPHRVASVSEFENSSSVEMCLYDKDSGDELGRVDGNWGLEEMFCCFKISEILYRAHFLAHEVLLPPYLHISSISSHILTYLYASAAPQSIFVLSTISLPTPYWVTSSAMAILVFHSLAATQLYQ